MRIGPVPTPEPPVVTVEACAGRVRLDPGVVRPSWQLQLRRTA